MAKNTRESFFASLRRVWFGDNVNGEIASHIGAHIRGEKDCGYPFTTIEEMDAHTERHDARAMLQTIEEHIRRMPTFYGKAFRHILHRDLNEWLQKYEHLARQRVQPATASRIEVIARRLELSQ